MPAMKKKEKRKKPLLLQIFSSFNKRDMSQGAK
jgi:hypothetical protein